MTFTTAERFGVKFMTERHRLYPGCGDCDVNSLVVAGGTVTSDTESRLPIMTCTTGLATLHLCHADLVTV